MRIIKIAIASLLLLMPFILSAQEKNDGVFSISAQLRARGEYRNGALYPRSEGDTPATFINNRARLSTNYKRSNLELSLAAQHVGVWGQDPQIDNNGRFMLNEAWAKLYFGENRNFFAQLGRQSLVYDDERLLGGLDWNVSGRFHDALKMGYEDTENKFHLILAFNQNSERFEGNYYAPGGQPYKNMQTLWYHYGNNSQPFGISLMFMNLGWQLGSESNSQDRFMQTMGTYLTYKEGIMDINGAFYYQSGRTPGNLSTSAFMGSLSGKVKLDPKWSLGVGADYLSGNDNDGDKYNAFNPLYGTHHKFYGAMDYFYASQFASSSINPGLFDVYAGIYFKASSKFDASLNYHYFSVAKDIQVNNENIKKTLGSEFDLQINYSIMPDVKLMAGYSFMLGTESMDIVKGGSRNSWQDWAWVSINITPKLFSSK